MPVRRGWNAISQNLDYWQPVRIVAGKVDANWETIEGASVTVHAKPSLYNQPALSLSQAQQGLGV
ncbi:hypothetical protein D1227_13020 [Henriciella mobilis]|nr:hypothetical protein D1231_06215 [Henriciella mobilis]RIJ20718.1 hypothetical protein D1227_13020 [Henriciella mobilis]